jgi:hypothetical protein
MTACPFKIADKPALWHQPSFKIVQVHLTVQPQTTQFTSQWVLGAWAGSNKEPLTGHSTVGPEDQSEPCNTAVHCIWQDHLDRKSPTRVQVSHTPAQHYKSVHQTTSADSAYYQDPMTINTS